VCLILKNKMDLNRRVLPSIPPRERQIVEGYLDNLGEMWERTLQGRNNDRFDDEMREIGYECAMDLYSFLMLGKWHVGSRKYKGSRFWGFLKQF
jgi:hypothetical protein